MSSSPEQDRAQRERALQTWELVIHESPTPDLLDATRTLLRIKRFELQSFLDSLPGVIRRGAEVDLAPLQAKLSELGVRSELRKTAA